MARITPFGISALSKFNKDVAYLNEIMCNKETGEILVKSPSGDTISYNYFSRLRANIEALSTASLFYCSDGDIYAISPNDIELPSVINTVDIDINTRFNIPNANGMIVTADIVAINIAENEISASIVDAVYLDYTITIGYRDGTNETITKHILVQDMISDFIVFKPEVLSVTLSNASIQVDGDTQYVKILNNMLLFISN